MNNFSRGYEDEEYLIVGLLCIYLRVVCNLTGTSKQMKRPSTTLFIISTFLLTSCATRSQKSCDDFKNGKFILKSRFDDSYSIINRNDSIQTEINSKTGDIVTAKIRWTSACAYELQYQTQTKNSSDTIVQYLQARPLKTTITKTTKNYCVFESHVDSVDLKYVDTLRVLRK
jgi:hypothetical protein